MDIRADANFQLLTYVGVASKQVSQLNVEDLWNWIGWVALDWLGFPGDPF